MNRKPASLGDFEARAKARLPSAQWEWLIGAAETGRTYQRNLDQFQDFYLRPRVLVGVTTPQLESTFFGRPAASPIIAAPVGHMTQFHGEGELAVMQACNTTNTHCVVSMHTRRNLELLAKAAGEAGWSYQLYLYSEPNVVLSQISRAVNLGATTIVLTVDSGHRSPSYQRQRLPWDARDHGVRDEPELPESRNDRVWTWAMVEELIDRVSVPVIVKGIQFVRDAMIASQTGCAGVWISNHGGRNNETDQSLLRELGQVREAVGPELPIIIDGGFRTGSDFAKALLLGASHVALGRPLIHGIIDSGARGVESVLRIVHVELEAVLGSLGVTDVTAIKSHHEQVARFHPREPGSSE